MATVPADIILQIRNRRSPAGPGGPGCLRMIEPETRNLIPGTCLSNRNSQELKIVVTHCKQKAATLSNRSSQPGKTPHRTIEPETCHLKPDSLIDSLPIRIGTNSFSLNKNRISNRQKRGIFLTCLGT